MAEAPATNDWMARVWEREKSKKQFVLIMKMSAFLHWPHSGIKDKDSLLKLDAQLPETPSSAEFIMLH